MIKSEGIWQGRRKMLHFCSTSLSKPMRRMGQEAPREKTPTPIDLDGSETELLIRAMRMKTEAIALATPEKLKIETKRLELENRRLDMQKEQSEKTISLFEEQREQTKNLMAQQQQQMAATTAMITSMGSILTKLAEKLGN